MRYDFERVSSTKRLIAFLAIVLGFIPAAWPATPAPIDSLRAIHQLSTADANRALPVAFEATVTYFRGNEGTLFVQNDGLSILVKSPANTRLVPGDRVLVRGTTQGSFRTLILGSSIALLHHGAVPTPAPATFDEMIRGQRDGILVTVRAVIRSANMVSTPQNPVPSVYLEMLTDEGNVDATVNSDDPAALEGLTDADVQVTGVEGGKFDDKMQQTGILLHVSSLANVEVLKRAQSSPWSLAITPMDEILSGYHVQNLTRRIRVHGIITYYQPGSAVVLQNGNRSMWVSTRTRDRLQIGDSADATGFPDVHDGFLTVTGGKIQDSGISSPVAPQPATWRQLADSGNRPEGHHYDLVSINGQVVSEVREAAQDEYVLVADGHLFSAFYRRPGTREGAPLPAMKQIPVGSMARVTGICMPSSSNPLNGPVAFDLLLRSFDDIVVVANPTWLNVQNLMLIVGFLLAIVFAVGAWGWTLEHKMRRQTAATAARIAAEAQLERQRSHILEDINGPRPLAEIIEQITEMASLSLKGAPVWCKVADGAQLGNYPLNADSLRVVDMEIPASSGPSLGKLSAGLDPLTPAAENDTDPLSMPAQLAALAIETRRLYSDLVHQSEFDRLTDIRNRFSLDKRLDALIAESHGRAGTFGLIYIDLNQFKQINDLYGHHAGDVYLQEVTRRMKRQLRSGDMLARLGGDEFAALAPMVRSRADVEDMVLRLHRCFDEPFHMEGVVFRGSASMGIALFPEDGVTKDCLLSAADAAMYTAKHAWQETQQMQDHR